MLFKYVQKMASFCWKTGPPQLLAGVGETAPLWSAAGLLVPEMVSVRPEMDQI